MKRETLAMIVLGLCLELGLIGCSNLQIGYSSKGSTPIPIKNKPVSSRSYVNEIGLELLNYAEQLQDDSKYEEAKEALEAYKRYAEELEKEINPEDKEEAEQSSEAIQNVIRQLEEEIPEEKEEPPKKEAKKKRKPSKKTKKSEGT